MPRRKNGLTERQIRIRDAWRAGKTLPQISAETGLTINNIGVSLAKMRRDGVYLPYRRRAYADVPYAFGTWDERLAEMDRRRESRRATIYKSAYVRSVKADPCSYCGGKGGTLDHVTPWIRGGTDDEANLVGACAHCNTSKHEHSLLFYLLRRRLVEQLALLKPPGARQAQGRRRVRAS